MREFSRPYASFSLQGMATNPQQFYGKDHLSMHDNSYLSYDEKLANLGDKMHPRPPFQEHNLSTNTYYQGWMDYPSFKWGGGDYATPSHVFEDQQGYAPQCQDHDPYQMRPNYSCAQRPDVYAYQEASQYEPNPPPYGYGPNFYDHQEPLQSFVPTHMEQNDLFHAQMPNEYAPPNEDSSSSSSTYDLMMQMCASIMDRMEGLDSKLNQIDESERKQEDICSLTFQWMNKRAEEEARQGDLPSNLVVNHNSLNDMDLEGGIQVDSIPCYYEEEEESHGYQAANSSGVLNVEHHSNSLENNEEVEKQELTELPSSMGKRTRGRELSFHGARGQEGVYA